MPRSGVPLHSAVPIASTSHGWLMRRGEYSARPLPAHSILVPSPIILITPVNKAIQHQYIDIMYQLYIKIK
jgi:hypothetical protein